ncbi:MAG: hypothetical protein H0W99_16420, partial [Acidobacteria bacterium]|nr:hypothetical protein [Acidobacteriota bacterium]
TIEAVNYTRDYNLHRARRDVMGLKTDGTKIYRRITAAVEAGASETLTVSSTLAGALSGYDRFSFLRYCTLSSDSVELRWRRANLTGGMICTCELSFLELLSTP